MSARTSTDYQAGASDMKALLLTVVQLAHMAAKASPEHGDAAERAFVDIEIAIGRTEVPRYTR